MLTATRGTGIASQRGDFSSLQRSERQPEPAAESCGLVSQNQCTGGRLSPEQRAGGRLPPESAGQRIFDNLVVGFLRVRVRTEHGWLGSTGQRAGSVYATGVRPVTINTLDLLFSNRGDLSLRLMQSN